MKLARRVRRVHLFAVAFASRILCSPAPLRDRPGAAARLHPRRHAPRQHHARAGLVGRGVLRPARAARPGRQHRPRLERHHLPGDRARRARCRSTSRSPLEIDSMRAGRQAPHLPARRQRVPRDARRASSPKAPMQDPHRLLPRPAARGPATAVGRRPHLGARSRRRHLDLDRLPGTRRQRLVAHQGHPGRRARQPARRAHRPRLAPGGRQRPAAGRDRAPPTGGRTWEWFVTSPINNYDVAPYIGRYAQYTDTYDGEGGRAHAGLPPARPAPRGVAPRAVGAGEADAPVLRALVRSRIPGTATATS